MPRRVLEDHDRVVDDESGGDGKRHQRQVVEAVAEQIHDAERDGQRNRHRDARNERRADVAQEQEHDQHDQRHRQGERASGVAQRSANRGGALHHHAEIDRARNRGAQCGQELGDAIDGLDDVGVGLPADDQQHGRPAIGRPRVPQVLDGVHDLRHVGDSDRRAVAVGDDERKIVRGGLRLVVGVDLPVAGAILHDALGPVRIRARDRRTDVLEADAVLVERLGVDLDPHRRKRAAADLHLAHALELRQLLRDDRRCRVVHLALRHRLRRQRQDHDRRVGRVDLAIGGVAVEARGQRAPRGVDRRLHVARRAVDVAIEIELQHDPRRAERARRRHLRDPGDQAQRALERHRDGRGHRFGARPRQRCGDRNGRQVDSRQRRYREQAKGDGAGQGEADGQERGRDRAIDEGRRDIHDLGESPSLGTRRRAPQHAPRGGARASLPAAAPRGRTRDR